MPKSLPAAALAAAVLFFSSAAARQRDEHQHAPTTITVKVVVVSKTSKPPSRRLEVRTLKPPAVCRVDAHGECELVVGRGKEVVLRVYDAKDNLLGSKVFDSSKDGDRKVTVQIP